MYVIFPAQDVVDWGYNTPTLVSPVDNNNTLNNNNHLVAAVEKMSASGQEYSLKQLSHPAFNEAIKLHNGVTFKLVKTVSDFAQQLAATHEHHAEELQSLVETFRKRNADLRRERPLYPSTLFNSWETFLQEVEVDSQIHSDIASILGRHVTKYIVERTFHRKVQSRKIFIHRESCETILSKTEELLFKCCKDYGDSYERLLVDRSPSAMEAYIDAHNAYVQQLHAANAIVDEYHTRTLPQLLEEMEEVYIDLSDTVARSVLEGAEIINSKTQEQSNRYETLIKLCKAVNSKADLEHYIKTVNMEIRAPVNGHKHEFRPPQFEVTEQNDMMMSHSPPIPYLKNEVIVDKGLIVPMKSKYDALKKEAIELETKLRSLQETLESLVRLQQRSLDSSLFNKANEIQEDISLKRFDLRVSQIHLAAVKAQIELLVTALENKGDNLLSHDRKMSVSSTGSMKSKWLKAFKSLKSGGSSSEKGQSATASSGPSSANSKNGANSNKPVEVAHIFQEYTYKKITACDFCHEILKGHTRQGMRCKMCKVNVHGGECQEKIGKCQPKPRLLRRQKSTSEIETRPSEKEDDTVSVRSSADTGSVFNLRNPFGSMKNRMLRTPPPSSPSAEGVLHPQSTEIDPIYQLLKQAGDLGGPSKKGSSGSVEKELTNAGIGVGGQGGGSGGSSGSSMSSLNKRTSIVMTTRSTQGSSPHSLAVTAHPPPSSCSAPHSPQRQKLNLRMKSLSLDSPESNEHVQRRRGVNSGGQSQSGTHPHSSHGSSHSQSPQSPVHSRRLLATRAVRMSSVDLPDENEKSLSSASTSPCPSPKPHRLLPTNLYVVLYNFKSRHQDELDLKAGYTVTVVDTTDPDWWKGKCLGKLGFFPSKYVAKLNPGERPLQVTHNLQVTDGDNGLKLLRDQIVIQVSDESEGMVPIRCGDRQGSCPLKYLQEV